MATARTIITRSLRKLGVIGEGEVPTASQSSDGLASLNAMVDSWSAEAGPIFEETKDSYVLTANDGEYTIGSGGDINVTRPIRINAAFVRKSGTDYPLQIIGKEQYARIDDKDQSGTPEKIYYDGNFPLGNLYLWPVPNDADTLFLYDEKALTTFTSLDTTLVAPPGYERALIFNLAVEDAPDYEVEPTPTTQRIAAESKYMVVSANQMNETDILSVDAALLATGGFNILTGQYT
jgi:hypothetical protein